MADSSSRTLTAVTLACAFALSLASGTALATQPVDPANDFFKSLPGTEVDLGPLGIIPLEGVPFDPDFSLETDTVVERKFPVPVGGGTIEIEIVALQLKSIAPVDLTPVGLPGQFADVWTTINRDGLPGIPVYSPLLPSVGQMQIQHGTGHGGNFESCFGDPGDPGSCIFLGIPGGGVYADAIFVIPGGDPGNPLDFVIPPQPAPRISLHTVGSTWVHEGQPPVGRGGPRGGPFGGQPRNSKVTSIIHNGPHPVEAVLFPINHFKVYKVDDVLAPFPVELEDQFSRQCIAPAVNAGNYCWTNTDCDSFPGSADGLCGTSNVWTLSTDFIDFIANPVNKLPEQNISDPFEHQVWYRLSTNDPVPQIIFPIDNQFGPQDWLIPAAANRWLVNPADKDLEGPPLAQHHYLCYDAVGVTFVPPGIRQLQDQFLDAPFDVVAPRVFCNPVQKTFGASVFPALDPEEHLACYDIDPQLDLNQVHSFLDQFAGWLLNVRQNEMLCVPSTKGVACTDTDGDTICDAIDNCPTVPNVGQADTDSLDFVGLPSAPDGVGDACDNCVTISNPRLPLSVLTTSPHLTLTGGQRDDDHDGYGNECDGDFDNAGFVIGGLDVNYLKASIGKLVSTDVCGLAGNMPCAIFDLDVTGPVTGGLDVNAFKFQNGKLRAPAPLDKCAACPLACVAGTAGDCVTPWP